jgi:hemerythrin-like domain-containing protein
MKRSPELTPLSHDHHQALFVAQKLKRADSAGDARESFLAFWQSHGRGHFAIEEDILLPGWVENDPGADREAAARVAAEHLEIRTEARRLERGSELELEQLQALGALLERHVRFEERELFPAIESALDPDAIARLGEEIAAAEADLRAARTT